MSDPGTQQDPKNDKDLSNIAKWVSEVTLYDRETEKWTEQSKRILERYKDYRGNQAMRGDDSTARYNVLWANTQTLQPNLYARNPKPDIQRRFKDADPVGRLTSDVLERCVTYFVDTDPFAATMRQCVTDYLLPGRGTTWLRYVPHMRQLEVTNSTEEGEEDPQEPTEVIDYEEVAVDYVNRADFGHNICRTWDEVWLVWRKVYMTRAELVKRFGEEGKTVPLDYAEKDLQGGKIDSPVDKAVIYEAWDKKREVAAWFHKKVEKALDVREDPLNLDGFFPCPKPIFTNLVNDSLIPTPMFIEYQDQALELDALTARITSITKSIKVAGAYDASVQALGRILSEGVDNTMIAVESWAMFAEKGGIAGAMSFLPIKEVADALLTLYQAREQVKSDLHEISGIPDVVRGSSDPGETLGAQQIKTSFATNRISDMQRDVQRFVRENVRIMVDIICNHFQPDTIKQISGVRLMTTQEKQQAQMQMQPPPQMPQQPGQPPQQPMPPPQPQLPPGMDMDQFQQLMTDPSWEDVFGLIKNNALRCFRIDIETDSTIKADEEVDKASRVEFLKAVGQFLQQAVEAGQQQPEMVPVLGQMLMFGIRGFPVGKELEGAMQTALTKMEKIASNPQPKPNPEMIKIQGEQQLAQQKMQGEQQMAQQQAQLDIQMEQAKLQNEAQIAQMKAQQQAQVDQHLNVLEAQRRQAELQSETQMAQAKMENEMALQREKAQGEWQLALMKANIDKEKAIEVARIAAKATAGIFEEEKAQSDTAESEGKASSQQMHDKLDQLLQSQGQAAQAANENAQAHAQGLNQLAQAHTQGVSQIVQAHQHGVTQLAQVHNQASQAIHDALTSEKEVVRDPKTGKPTGVRIKPKPKDLAQGLRQ